MPCRSEPDPNEVIRDLYKRFEHDSELAEMLCHVMTFVEESGLLSKVNGPTFIWWSHHKARDAHKREQEQRAAEETRKINDAKAKLTPEERRLLGIKD
jgi:hypothetical protein